MHQSNCNSLMFLALLGLFLGGALSEAYAQPAPVGRPPTAVQQEETVIRREHVIVHGPMIVHDAPPPLRTEVITVAPSPQHAWVPGYWTWRNDEWVWQSGYWESRPYPDAQWVPGQWVATANGWRWKDGQWQ
ncbi:MAG: hypothetical protein P9D89_02525 [Candidatus Contendobacter sp.]|nr:hypothetical protein [Candidatus Contendobacter sp.]